MTAIHITLKISTALILQGLIMITCWAIDWKGVETLHKQLAAVEVWIYESPTQ